MPKCVKCGKEAEELPPEGDCFECSTGDSLDSFDITNKNIRESLHNIAEGLAVKTDLLTTEAKTRMREATDRGGKN